MQAMCEESPGFLELILALPRYSSPYLVLQLQDSVVKCVCSLVLLKAGLPKCYSFFDMEVCGIIYKAKLVRYFFD